MLGLAQVGYRWLRDGDTDAGGDGVGGGEGAARVAVWGTVGAGDGAAELGRAGRRETAAAVGRSSAVRLSGVRSVKLVITAPNAALSSTAAATDTPSAGTGRTRKGRR